MTIEPSRRITTYALQDEGVARMRYCLTCQYDLSGLQRHRCPECGRDFDPQDPSTFDDEQYAAPRLDRFILIMLGMYLVLIVAICLASRSGVDALLAPVLALALHVILLCGFYFLHWAAWHIRRLTR